MNNWTIALFLSANGVFGGHYLIETGVSDYKKPSLSNDYQFEGSADNCIVANIDYYGNDIKKIKNIRSAKACSCECQKHVRCKFFTWIEKKKFCWLKTKIGKTTEKNGVHSGSMDCCPFKNKV